LAKTELVSYEPATGAELWRAEHGDVDAIVDRARRAWPQWAAKPLATRIELLRRFVNEVRKEQEAFAELIARENPGTSSIVVVALNPVNSLSAEARSLSRSWCGVRSGNA
jgi:acyl-CoA reductase-like NAD-dependent aldehyde dehydrogenase